MEAQGNWQVQPLRWRSVRMQGGQFGSHNRGRPGRGQTMGNFQLKYRQYLWTKWSITEMINHSLTKDEASWRVQPKCSQTLGGGPQFHTHTHACTHIQIFLKCLECCCLRLGVLPDKFPPCRLISFWGQILADVSVAPHFPHSLMALSVPSLSFYIPLLIPTFQKLSLSVSLAALHSPWLSAECNPKHSSKYDSNICLLCPAHQQLRAPLHTSTRLFVAWLFECLLV